MILMKATFNRKKSTDEKKHAKQAEKKILLGYLCHIECCPLNVSDKLEDNCIQNFHLGRYIVGYTVRNLVLRRFASRAVKCDFRITSPNENFENS